jgi:hypothetical protein
MWELLSFFDNHAGAIQAVAAIVIACLTLWLILATLKYVRVADDSLKLAHQQFAEATRIEVFLKLRTVPQTSTAFESFVDLANLSSLGIWWEKYSVSVTAREKNTTSKVIEIKVQKVVAAYAIESVSCAQAFYRAYRTTGLPQEKPITSVKVQATYRAGGKWHTAQFEVPEIVLLGKYVFLATEEVPPDDF